METAEDTHDKLVNCMRMSDTLHSVSFAFATAESTQQVNIAYLQLKKFGLLPELKIDEKSNNASARIRELGNKMYLKKMFKRAVEYYTESIAMAELNSEELAISYANRSAVLFENKLYKECLKDIDRAIQSKYPQHLMPKLKKRQDNALKLISSQFAIKYAVQPPSIPDEDRNDLIQCATKSVKIQNIEGAGRGVVATKDIAPGEIICVEHAIYSVLIEQFYTHCHNCLNVCYNLIPCRGCTSTLYCGEQCQQESEQYHKYECPILLTIRQIGMDKLDTMALKIAISVKDRYAELDRCTLDKDGVYRSDRYDEIHNLEASTTLRSVSDRFSRATTAALFFHLVKNFTDFFENKESSSDEDTFKYLVYLHKQTGACNFHEIAESNYGNKVQIGAGAFSFHSIFNHSCCPNVTRRDYGRVSAVCAIESIKKGEQCYDNYGYHHAVMAKEERQKKLNKQYYFHCACEACKNNYPLFPLLPDLFVEHDLEAWELEKLTENNLVEAKKMYSSVIKKINNSQSIKPNKTLSGLQEVLKKCFDLFDTVQVPF